MRKKITVNTETCIHCGLCVQDCVVGCLGLNEEKIPQYLTGKEENCVACQHCMAICPSGALSFGDKKSEDSLPTAYGHSEELLRLIQSRRSV